MSTETLTLIVAIALTVIGIGAFGHYFVWVGTWPRTSGKVVGNEARKSGHHRHDQYSYFPRVEFIAADRLNAAADDAIDAARVRIAELIHTARPFFENRAA